MRTALKQLTKRGRFLLALGVIGVVVSLFLGQRDLLRFGVLLVALPLLSAALVSRTRYRLASARGAVKLQTPRALPGGGVALAGQIKDPARSGQAAQATASLTIDGDERIIQAECTCNFFRQNRLRKGPCEHVLALRMAQKRQAVS